MFYQTAKDAFLFQSNQTGKVALRPRASINAKVGAEITPSSLDPDPFHDLRAVRLLLIYSQATERTWAFQSFMQSAAKSLIVCSDSIGRRNVFRSLFAGQIGSQKCDHRHMYLW